MTNVDSTPLCSRYTLGKGLGSGVTCTAFLCTENSPPYGRYACKSFSKPDHNATEEIKIMHHLSDCPGVVRIKESFHDANRMHIVMELCEGGNLFERISKRKWYNEEKAARIMRTIIKVVVSCHSLGVMHGDLKPENFLFVREGDDSDLKVTDFGQSSFFEPGEVFTEATGSPYYMAPEVLETCYGPEADIWSAGVILYVLLSGRAPFHGETNIEVFNEILGGKLDFETQPWPTVSNSAKDLVRKMLNENIEERLTAHQVLCHEWMVDNGIPPEGPLEPAVLTRLRNFSDMNKLKKLAIRYTAERLPEEETSGLREMYKIIEIDNSGEITFDKLKNELKRLGSEAEDSEIKALMDAADTDGSGTIDRKEFVTAMFHMNKIEREANLRAAFKHFDREERGYITLHEILEVCLKFGFTDDNLEDAFRETDQNNDGKIDYDEFVAMMKGGSIAG